MHKTTKSLVGFGLAVTFALALGASAQAASPAPAPTPAADSVDINRIAQKTMRFAKSLVGKLPSVAARAATAHGYSLRIISVDGVGRPVTMDYWATRINLEFRHGRISKVSVG